MATLDYSGVCDDSDLVRQWLRGRPDSTKRAYEPVALAFVKECGPLKTTTVERVTAYTDALMGQPATRARMVSTIKSLLSWAWRTGYTPVNVGRALRCVRVPSTLHRKLISEDEVKALIGACPKGGRNHALLVLLYVSGLRISEAISLNVGDLRGRHVSVTGKGTRSRTVLIPQAAADLLKSLQEGVQQPRQKAIFISETTGERLGVRAAREAVYKAALKVGERLPPHWLRHAHASHALDRGAPIHVVQAGLGHASVATTSKYLHVKPGVGPSDYLQPV